MGRRKAPIHNKTQAKLPKEDLAAIDTMLLDPAVFAQACFGRWLWSRQIEIADAVLNRPPQHPNRYTAVRSGHGVGKSATAALITLLYLARYPHSIVVTTAPTWRQVAEILWKEIGILAAKGKTPIILPSGRRLVPFGNECGSTTYRIDRDWYAIGVSTNKPENFQGIHAAGGVLVIADEASGIDDPLYEAMQGLLTGPNDRMLAISNPTKSSGWFFDIFHHSKLGAGWNKFHIDCEQTPWNVAGLPPPAPGLCSKEWIASMVEKFGRDHPLFRVRVNGEFDTRLDKLMIPLHLVMDAATEERRAAVNVGEPCCLGVDIGYTGDLTVLTRLHGDLMTHQKKIANADPMEVAGAIIAFCREHPVDLIGVDAGGLGLGTYSRLAEQRWPVYGFNGAESAIDDGMYGNRRAESYDMLAHDFKAGIISILDDEDLIGQLAYQPYKTDSRGRLLLLSKDDMKKEGRTSPDCSDSLAIARYTQRLWVSGYRGGGHTFIEPTRAGVFG